ncbi:hypothetical protein ACDA27_004703, partial [Salmonella enterica]
STEGVGLVLNSGVLSGSGQVSGHSESGRGVVTTGNSRVDGVSLDATSSRGTGLDVQGRLEKAPGASINSSSSKGLERVVYVTSDNRDVNAAAVQARRLQSVTAGVSSGGGQPVVAGPVPGGMVPVPQKDYRVQEQMVNLSVCTDGDCRPLLLDVNRPSSSGGSGEEDATTP